MRELDMTSIFFGKTDWLSLQSLLFRYVLLWDKLDSVVRPQFVDVSFLGTSARACQMRASRNGGYLSSYYWRRDVMTHLDSGRICWDFWS